MQPDSKVQELVAEDHAIDVNNEGMPICLRAHGQ